MTTATLTATPATPFALGASSKRPARRVLPGFHLTLGYTLFYLCLIVLIPLSALLFKTFTLSWAEFWAAVASPRVLASYRLTFGVSFLAAVVNVFAGLLLAWVLVRYSFPGKKIIDALVDLPFALPTAVAGISLTAMVIGPIARLELLPMDASTAGSGDIIEAHIPAQHYRELAFKEGETVLLTPRRARVFVADGI